MSRARLWPLVAMVFALVTSSGIASALSQSANPDRDLFDPEAAIARAQATIGRPVGNETAPFNAFISGQFLIGNHER